MRKSHGIGKSSSAVPPGCSRSAGRSGAWNISRAVPDRPSIGDSWTGRRRRASPGDSGTIRYVNGREPVVWHHDVLHADGTPYRQAEVDLIRALTRGP
ncbi:MAG TPA: hypothetical protein DEP35_16040 [Deltaproteobacteria bacterium]|nr:hypothetical protein [Deltaproteobacteria bacterium]